MKYLTILLLFITISVKAQPTFSCPETYVFRSWNSEILEYNYTSGSCEDTVLRYNTIPTDINFINQLNNEYSYSASATASITWIADRVGDLTINVSNVSKRLRARTNSIAVRYKESYGSTYFGTRIDDLPTRRFCGTPRNFTVVFDLEFRRRVGSYVRVLHRIRVTTEFEAPEIPVRVSCIQTTTGTNGPNIPDFDLSAYGVRASSALVTGDEYYITDGIIGGMYILRGIRYHSYVRNRRTVTGNYYVFEATTNTLCSLGSGLTFCRISN